MTTSAALLERDAQGDGARTPTPDALRGREPFDLGALYDEHFDFVWRTLRRYGVPESGIDDAVQDAFLVIHSNLDKFEGRSSLRTWIFGVARRVARDHRPRTRELGGGAEGLEMLPDVASKSPLATLEDVEAASLLERLLAHLDPRKREAFILVELEEMTVLEAGQALDSNANTIAARVRAARRELKLALARVEANRVWRERCET